MEATFGCLLNLALFGAGCLAFTWVYRRIALRNLGGQPEDHSPIQRLVAHPRAPWVLWPLSIGLGLLLLAFFVSFILAMGNLAPTMYWMLLTGPVATLAAWWMLRGALSPSRIPHRMHRLQDRAAGGDPEALCALGLLYLQGGQGHPKDTLEARQCFLKAAQLGHPEAMFELSELLRWGAGGPRDAAAAREWLTQASAHGSHRAQARLQDLQALEADQGLP